MSARVVERCEVRVPEWVRDEVLKRRPRQAIEHRCRGRTPARVDLAPGPPPWAGPAAGPPAKAVAWRPGTSTILVTLSY